MLTVKIIDVQGFELVKEAKSVFYCPMFNESSAKVSIFLHDGRVEETYLGDVYVMNENGKTVADYHLSPPPK